MLDKLKVNLTFLIRNSIDILSLKLYEIVENFTETGANEITKTETRKLKVNSTPEIRSEIKMDETRIIFLFLM